MGEKKIEKMIDKKTLAKEVGMSLRYIDKAMRENDLPYYKLGASVRFRYSEVEKWLRERKANG